MEIYIHKNEQQLGPFNFTEVREMVSSGRVTLKDWAWHEGLSEWVALESIEIPNPNTPSTSEEDLERLKILACLNYMGHSDPQSLTNKEGMKWLGGSLVQDDAKAQAEARERFEKWSKDKLTLHPELFRKEIKEQRQKRLDGILAYFSERREECEELGLEPSTYSFPPAAIEKAVDALDQAKPDWSNGMFGEDDPDEIKPEIIEEVFIPTLKKVSGCEPNRTNEIA